MNGKQIRQVELGQQVTIIGAVNNTVYKEDKSMVTIIEVRDPNGITNYLAYQGTIIEYNEKYSFGISWMPNPHQITDMGTYSIRVWALTCLCDDAEVLSAVLFAEIDVV